MTEWIEPITWDTGLILNPNNVGIYIKDNMDYLATEKPTLVFRDLRLFGDNLTGGTWGTMYLETLDDVLVETPSGAFVRELYYTKFYIPKTGIYLVTIGCSYGSSAAMNNMQLGVFLNGTQIGGNVSDENANSTGLWTNVTVLMRFAEDDYLEFKIKPANTITGTGSTNGSNAACIRFIGDVL